MNASDTSHTASAADDANGPGDNRHYLRALTDMADRGSVLTHDAIYTDRGIKLVDKGARVDSQLYDRLVKHKLRGNIEDHLSVENMVSVQSVLQVARAQCESDTLAYLLVQKHDNQTALQHFRRASQMDPGLEEAQFQALALAAKRDCPLSKALASVPEITLQATLLPSTAKAVA